VLNNYYNTDSNNSNTYLIGPGKEMSMVVENNHMDVASRVPAIKEWGGSVTGYRSTGNIGTAKDMNREKGSVFKVPYKYDLVPASQVKAMLTNPKCGAGNTCTFKR